MENKITDFKKSVVVLYRDLSSFYKQSKGLKVSYHPNRNKYSGNGVYLNAVRDVRNSEIQDRYKSQVAYFQNVLEYYFPEELLINYYRNIASCNVYGVMFQMGDFTNTGKFSGKYNPFNNDIVLDLRVEEKINSIYHELFHLASTRRNHDGSCQVGFSHFKKNGKLIFNRLNEGYTTLLAMRYFSNAGYTPAYPNEVFFAGLLEQVVGPEKMQELYLTANPRGLYDEMLRYDEQDNVNLFFRELDTIYDYSPIQVKRLGIDNLLTFLIRAYYVKKQKELGYNNPNVYHEMISFIRQIPPEIFINGQKYIIDVQRLYREAIELFNYQEEQSKKRL